MPLKIRYLEDEKIIHLISEGIITFETIKQAAILQAKYSVKYDTLKWLNTISPIGSIVSIFDLYRIPELFHILGVDKKTKLAIVSNDGNDKKRARFVETVCLNSGYNLKIFKHENEAKEWLQAV